MIKIFKFLPLLIIISATIGANAQDPDSLIAEGNRFYDARNYKGAIIKYEEALKTDSANLNLRYKLAFSLNSTGDGKKALPHLEAVVRAKPPANVLSSSYGMIGGIYDKIGMPAKAIENYQKGIKIDSLDYSLRYGIGLAYFRNHQYLKAEESAIEALKINPLHSGSMRLYALVTFHQNKRAPALLGLCSFLYMEPKGPQSTEAYTNLQSILKGGILKTEPGVKAVAVLAGETRAQNLAISNAVAAAAKRSNSGLLAGQLKAIFIALGNLQAEQKGGSFFYREQLVPLYSQLGQSSYLPAFVDYISQNNDRNAASRVSARHEEIKQLKAWIKSVSPW